MVVSFGDGCDVFSLRVEPGIENIRDRRGIKHHLEAKRLISSYEKYLLWRELTPTQPAPRPPIVPVSAPALWRDREWGLSLHGSRCNKCGTPQYPRQRVCVVCQSVDDYEQYPFYDKKATLFTFSHDNLAAALDPPTTICNVDFEGGGRILFDMADSNPEQVTAGMEVEMTFRKLHYVNGIHNYWWKCSPVRC